MPCRRYPPTANGTSALPATTSVRTLPPAKAGNNRGKHSASCVALLPLPPTNAFLPRCLPCCLQPTTLVFNKTRCLLCFLSCVTSCKLWLPLTNTLHPAKRMNVTSKGTLPPRASTKHPNTCCHQPTIKQLSVLLPPTNNHCLPTMPPLPATKEPNAHCHQPTSNDLTCVATNQQLLPPHFASETSNQTAKRALPRTNR